MTISRGQMKRQLYMGGGIMDAMPRQQYGLGSFVKKAFKKVTGAVKDVASSDIGKAALLAGAGMYAGGIGPFASGKFGAGFASNLLPSSIGSTVTNMFSKKGVQSALVKGGALAGLTGFLTSQYGIPEEEQEELLSDPAEKEKYLRMYYTNLNPNAGSDEIETFVRDNAAMGGRMGFENGGTYEDFEKFMMRRSESLSERHKEELRKQFEMYMRSKEPTVEAAEGGRIGFAKGGDDEFPLGDPTAPVNPFAPTAPPGAPVLPNKAEVTAEQLAMDLFGKTIEMLTGEQREMLMMMLARSQAQDGGIMNRMNYAMGDTASENAMQAAGIEGLPVRQNPKGVKELDLRDNGGFIPPVGIKEKEDDIPAMLSNNEFVFTADAVRGMGDGDVELGAQRMYDQMKMLEEGGRV